MPDTQTAALMTRREVADYLGVAIGTVDVFARRGLITLVQAERGSKRYYTRESVEKLGEAE